MKARLLWFLALPALVMSLTAQAGPAERPKGHEKDEAALAKSAEAFIEAFDKGDAKALAAFWTVGGDYTDQTGRHMKGRAAIEKAFKTLFAENKGLKLRINSNALKFVTADVAIEDGTTEVIPADGGPPNRARYTNVHVKKDGEWLLSSVREAVFAPPSNYEHLRGLEWALGEWIEEGEKGAVGRVSFVWAQNRNFIVSTFANRFKDMEVGSGTQWIGWDPTAKGIRSWSFDSTGGFGQGAWTREKGRWLIKTKAVLPNGKRIAATNIVTHIDADTISWQSKDRTMDDKALPDTMEIRMKRVK